MSCRKPIGNMFNRKDKLPRSKIQNQKELGRERRNRAVKREEPLLGIGKSRAESGIKKKKQTQECRPSKL